MVLSGSAAPRTACAQCAHGRAAPLGGQTACAECAAGRFQASDFAACVGCQPGHIQPEAGQSGCAACPAHTFQAEGFVACTACPAGSGTDRPCLVSPLVDAGEDTQCVLTRAGIADDGTATPGACAPADPDAVNGCVYQAPETARPSVHHCGCQAGHSDRRALRQCAPRPAACEPVAAREKQIGGFRGLT